ncbi:class I SAM-dependent methyltransferase [Pelagibius marinus]|uniref:class I SAM-dependent methyltransferase n=1 Tax=Pelagibius marinus TaxID=2762760 RepID=UPI001872C0F0|nr:class I SAM-dependent methyltransferase [Pelagibius marinus]
MEDGPVVSGTEGYGEEAPNLVDSYERPVFDIAHADVLHLLPPPPAAVLDIGAGTGRDAAALAARGHRVVAVEPTAGLREPGKALHCASSIEWIDDSLPELARLADRPGAFDVIMMTAVWMHLDADQRRRGMPAVARLLAAGGVLILTLRHGPVPPGRRMFEITGAETIALAAPEGLVPVFQQDHDDGFFHRPEISWTRLAFRKDGI